MNRLEFTPARGICAQCGAPIKENPKVCSICGRSYCSKHEHMVTLVHKDGPDVFPACNDCIRQHGYKVVDPTHPLYLNNN